MKILNGAEICDFIMSTQARKIRGLKQHFQVHPKLVFISTLDDSLFDLQLADYCEQIDLDMESILIDETTDFDELMGELNNDQAVTGIVVDRAMPSEVSGRIKITDPKDIDDHGNQGSATPAIITGINWLLASYNVDSASQPIYTDIPVIKKLLEQYPLSDRMQFIEKLEEVGAGEATGLIAIVSNLDSLGQIKASPKFRLTAIDMTGIIDASGNWRTGVVPDDNLGRASSNNIANLSPARGGLGPVIVASMIDNLIQASYPRG